jgi:hypothetical protein
MSKTKLYPVVVKYSETIRYENEVYVDEGMLNQINDGSFTPDTTFINGITKTTSNGHPVFTYPDIVEEWYDEDNIDIQLDYDLPHLDVTKVVLKDGDGYKVEPYRKKNIKFSDAEVEGMVASAN